jgi:hypothetical protein
LSNYCGTLGGERSCEDKKKKGVACTNNVQCSSNSCVSSICQ